MHVGQCIDVHERAGVMDKCCWYLLMSGFAIFGNICTARNQHGTISLVGPAFVNREITLKASPFYPWGCHVEWRYIMEDGTQFQTLNGQHVKRYSEDGSFFLQWWASIEYNRSDFYARCSTNTTIRTRLISLNMKDIVGTCGALVLLSPIVRDEEVKLGYFPSDYSIQRQTYIGRTWKKNLEEIELRKSSYEEEIVSEYFYILILFNFEERDEGKYFLSCNQSGTTDSVQLHIPNPPSYPVIGPKSADFNTTECIYVDMGSDLYCKSENGTEPVQVILLLGQDSFVHAESKGDKGLYRFHNVHQQMNGLSRLNVTCLVSNAALETPYKVHGILCNVETGSMPELTVPKFLFGESSTSICEVRNAVPAPAIELHIGKVLLSDVKQNDSFNGSSHTFTSIATMKKTNKIWNGKEMCCTRKSKYDSGIKNVSVCQKISMKYPPTDISISVIKTHDYNNNISAYFLNVSCQTNESNPPCTIKWSNDNDNLRCIYSRNWTNKEHGSYRSFSNMLYKVTKDMAGGTITCSTRCDNFPSHLNKNDTVYFSGGPTLHLNTTSPVNLYPNITMIGKCFVDDCNSTKQWTLRWEDDNNTEIKTCKQAEECLLILNYTGNEEITYICTAWKSDELLRKSLTVLNIMTKEATTKPAQDVTQQWYMSVIYVVSGTVVVLTLATCTGLHCRRCKTHVYETLLSRRTAGREQNTHWYDDIQSNIETTALHDLREVSASAVGNKDAPPLLDMEGNQVRSNENVSHYEYVDTPSAQRDHRTNAPNANYIHAV